MNSTETSNTTVPLGQSAHLQASQFAAAQRTPQQGKKTYLNTLAIYAVHQYLKWLQIETDLIQGDSWHPVKRALFDVADLVLPGVGKLECCPVLLGETRVVLPIEAMQDRVGYVLVQFGENLQEAQILGFIRATDLPDTVDAIAIADLYPLDHLLDLMPEVSAAIVRSNVRRINLSQWLQNTFDAGWQSLETWLGSNDSLAFSLRTQSSERTIQRAKLIDLGLQLGNQAVILLVAIAPDQQETGTEPEAEILVQVHPVPGEPHVPPNLQLQLLDESGETLQTVRSRERDNYIQLKRFQGISGECFDIQLMLGTTTLTETFVI